MCCLVNYLFYKTSTYRPFGRVFFTFRKLFCSLVQFRGGLCPPCFVACSLQQQLLLDRKDEDQRLLHFNYYCLGLMKNIFGKVSVIKRHLR